MKDTQTTVLKPSRYNILAGFKGTHLIVHNLLHEKGFMVAEADANRLRAILDNPGAYADDPLHVHLIEAGCLIPADKDEQVEIARKKERFLRSQDNTLNLTIIPTYQCNFKCIYCWEHTKDTNDGMPPDAQERLLKYIEGELPNVTALNIDWFGGEPLMAFSVIENLSRRIDAMCKAARIPYFCSLTSNGFLLTEERFRFLLKHHTRFFQVTLDGPEELHNRNRPLKSGRRAEAIARENPEALGKTAKRPPRGTFGRILQNLRAIRDNVSGRFEFIVRVNVTDESRAYIDEFLAFYKAEFGDDWRFRLYLQGVEEHDGLRADVMGDKYLDKHDDIVERLFDTCIEDDLRLSSLRVDNPGDLMCKSRHPNAYFVNSDGSFYKCDMCMTPRHVTFAGTVSEEGGLQTNADNLAKWNAIEPPGYCSGCVLQPLCFGLKCPYYNTIQGKTRCELFNSYGAARNAVKTFAQEGKYQVLS
jgi:uncharacterized protein